MDYAQPTSGFIIKIAIDTQILAYLVDKSYPKLNLFFECLKECPFVDITCSRFATYEFAGIRKYEHYLRAIHDKSNSTGGTMNFSSVLKYKNDWSAKELPYQDIFGDIKKKVEDDLKKANDDFGITYNEGLHDELWGPQQDLVLSSKISKEDSLVLLSSMLPRIGEKEDYLVFLTNDDQFHKSFCGSLKMDSIDQVFEKYGLDKPHVIKIDSLKGPISKSQFNLIAEENTEDEIREFAKKFILEHIKNKNLGTFLGKVKPCPNSKKGELLCFGLERPSLENNIYISILSPNLEFLYNHPVKLVDFFSINQIENYPYIPDDTVNTSKNISVKFVDDHGNFLEEAEWNKLTEPGNLIFLHPDSSI